MSLNSPYFDLLRARVRELGGMCNAHLHLDRSGTLSGEWQRGSGAGVSESHLSLPSKHRLFSQIHDGPDFAPSRLKERVERFIDAMVEAGTTRADTLVDVTPDRVGLTSLEVMLEIKERRGQEIDLRLGSYTPMGFMDSEPKRWRLFQSGCEIADFLGSLPERDDLRLYPDHIGFAENCRRILALGQELGKPIQVHLDQHNDPREAETEAFLDIVRETGLPSSTGGEPMVWIVHLISPSLYGNERFFALVDQLVALDIGVICCPSAALSMRQLRPLPSPTGNSIARVLEMAARGVHVRLGSDNIADICSPAGTPDLLDELFVLCNAVRYYDPAVLARFAVGQRLNDEERQLVASHLEYDAREVARLLDDGGDHKVKALM